MEETETTATYVADETDADVIARTMPVPVTAMAATTPDLPPPAVLVDASLVEQMAALQKRTNLMLGAMGVLLAVGLVAIALLFGRVADANDNAAEAQAELATSRADLERVEAGAALYSSQIEGFQQKLVELRPQISAGVEEAITGLRTFGESTIEFPVKIDQMIPVETEVVINRTVQVPIKTTIPINQSFDTTIKIDTPLGKVPLDVTVPVDVDVPVDLTVDIPINETVPIKDEIPVKLDVPVKIDVSETQLKELTDSIAAGPTLGDSHQMWQMNEINKLIWPNEYGIGFIDEDAWNRTVEIAQSTPNLEGATVLTAPPTDGAYTNDVVNAAYALLGSDVDLMGAGFTPADVTLNPGGN